MKLWQQPRQPLAGLWPFAALGIIAADYFPVDPLLPLILLLALAVLLCLRRSNTTLLIFAVFAFFMLHDFQILDSPGRRLAREFSTTPAPVKATGIVISEPLEKQNARNMPTSSFRLRLESIDTGSEPHSENAVLQIAWVGESPKYGDRVSITGDAMNIGPPRNPGQFDYREYLNRLGIDSEIRLHYPDDGEILDSGHGNPLIALSISCRQWMQDQLRLDIAHSLDASGVIQGMVLGQKNEAPDDVRELFQRTGTLHLFVVNGLHIGMFTFIVFIMLRILGASRTLCIVIALPLIWFYTLLTGLNPGSIRASLMATIFLVGWLVDGKPLMLNNLGAAGLLLLLYDTNELFMPGYQFSMGVVLAIILLTDWLSKPLLKLGAPDAFLPRHLWTFSQERIQACWKWFSSLVGVSIAAFIGSLPFTAYYFHMLSPAALIANPVIVPLAFGVLWLGVLSIISATFSATLAAFFNGLNLQIAHLILRAVHLFAQIPLGHTYVQMPSLSPPECRVTVFDLTTGGAVHIRSKGRDWLIDCGSKASYESIILPALCSRGVNRLDGFILAQSTANHIGAAIDVEDDFAPRLTADSPLTDHSKAHRDFHHWLSDHHTAAINFSRGATTEISRTAKLRILYPPADLNTSLADDKALVILLECDGTRILFISGSGVFTERWLLEHEPALHCDILVKNQHSGPSGTPDFLAAVQPKVIIASVAAFPPTSHLDEAWAGDIKKNGIALFREDQTGSVEIDLDHNHVKVTPFLGGGSWSNSDLKQ
ncbi:MAG: ComEC/Rec2 family competence protein [Chthoniobacteraceae bacterium]